MNPDCPSCPFTDKCAALASDMIRLLPVKQGKQKVRKRYFQFLVYPHEGSLAIEKRSGKDIWQGLYQFPLIETDHPVSVSSLEKALTNTLNQTAFAEVLSEEIKHTLSHQRIIARIWKLRTEGPAAALPESWTWVKEDDLHSYPMPRLLTRWLENQKP
jgi:A/G-specific adenine glycosylase